ncbi:MAG: AgmX/PglI C-terminal domain-containing protein [Myxococcota bacterium]
MNKLVVGLPLVLGLGCAPSGSTAPPAETAASPAPADQSAPSSESETAITENDEPPKEGTTPVAVGDQQSEDLEGGGGGDAQGPSRPVPRVKQAKAQVEGELFPDIVRRIVRAHINEIRYCYNQGLQQHPTLEGRVVVQFVIGPDGYVESATSFETVPADDSAMTAVGQCSAERVAQWRFPKPADKGKVVVTYPFELSPQ